MHLQNQQLRANHGICPCKETNFVYTGGHVKSLRLPQGRFHLKHQACKLKGVSTVVVKPHPISHDRCAFEGAGPAQDGAHEIVPTLEASRNRQASCMRRYVVRGPHL